MMQKPLVIALEEHFMDAEIRAQLDATGVTDPSGPPGTAERLADLGEKRIKGMDEAGIDIQVLSQTATSVQYFDPETAVAIARRTNDRLHEACRAHPTRFAAFATMPTPDPKAAADELERTVTQYGFKGGMLHGLTAGRFHDDKRFWPIFERAAALDVPMYIHPAFPNRAVVDAYYKDYMADWPVLAVAGWGFTVETATQGIRMVLSGIFETYPNLQIILGHLGEGIPFYLWRINANLGTRANPGFKPGSKSFRDIFCEHFYVTTSGFFSNPALQCTITEMGIDRVMFSVDYPYADNAAATKWIGALPLDDAGKAKILSGNVKRLLKM